jgi:hypothetical protein
MSGWRFDWRLDWRLDWRGFEVNGALAGYGPDGAHTFVLDLENGFSVKHSWVTDVIKFKGGVEQRISRNDIDRQSFSGNAFLLGEGPRATRATLARHAASGSVLLIAAPHEELSVAGVVDEDVTVNGIDLCDWAKPGQRVLACRTDDEDMTVGTPAVIQEVVAELITLDVAPGDCHWIAPLRHVFLEPQQNFPRYPVEAESWQLDARCAFPLDFVPDLASMAFTPIAGVDLAIVRSRVFGLAGNDLTFALDAAGIGTGALVEGAGGHVIFYFEPDVTTMGDLATALESSAFVVLGGDYDPSVILEAGDAFAQTALTGSEDSGDVGTGASITNYSGDGQTRPVWDRALANDGTVTDGIHAMTQIIDHGGIPYALGTADAADWFRAVNIRGGDRATWQWFKLFMSTVVGQQKAFWLSTWREDLAYVSHDTGGPLTITIDADDGDFTAWYPAKREHLQILYADGTELRVRIESAENNGDGTRTLTVSDLAEGTITMLSWLELCRFENGDGYETQHNANGFDVSMVARVVRQEPESIGGGP